MNPVPTDVAPPAEDLRIRVAVLEERLERWTEERQELRDERARLQQELARLQQELRDERARPQQELRDERERFQQGLARLQQELRDERARPQQELARLQQELKDERTKLQDEREVSQQELMEKMRLEGANAVLQKEVQLQQQRIDQLERELDSKTSRRVMAGGGTPATTSSTYAAVYKGLSDSERLQRVGLTSVLGVTEFDEPPEDFFPDQVLATMQNVREAAVQKAMNEQLSKAARQLADRWYVDMHNKALLDSDKPDAAVFTDRDVHVAQNVLFLLEYKSGDSEGITDASLGQAMSYGSKLLSECRWRTLVFVVLVNGHRLQVVKVEAGQPRRRATICIELSFSREGGKASAGLAALWHLLRMPRFQLGLCAVPLSSNAVPARYQTLAVGGYSTVFLGKLDQQGTALPTPWPKRFVAKVFARLYATGDGRRPDTCFEPEYQSLSAFQQLRDSDDSKDWWEHLAHLPKLIKGPQALGVEGCAPAVPDGGDANAAVPPEPAGEEQPRFLYMEFEGEASSRYCKHTSFRGLVLALEVAHKKAKRVHRDIRPPNVTFHDDGRACLIDWGLSAPLGSEESVCICHAFSPIECPCSQAGDQRYGAKDDLCSLVLLYVFMCEQKGSRFELAAGARREEREKHWPFTQFSKSLYDKALACDYEGLANALRPY